MNWQQILGLIVVIFFGLMLMQCMGQRRVVYVNAPQSYAAQPRYLAVPQQQYAPPQQYAPQPVMRRPWCPPKVYYPSIPRHYQANRGPVPNVFMHTQQGRRVYNQYVARRPSYGGPRYQRPYYAPPQYQRPYYQAPRYAMPPRPYYGPRYAPRPPQVFRPQPPRGYYGGGGHHGGGHHRRH